MVQRIRLIDNKRLSEYPDVGLAMAWIMAGHDFYATLHVERDLGKQVDNKLLTEFIQGGRFYLVRLMCSIASEAIRLVEPTQSSESVMRLLRRHDWVVEAFDRLTVLHTQGAKNNTDMALIQRIRNKGTFHYFDWRPQEQKIPVWLKDGLDTAINNGERFGRIIDGDHAPCRLTSVDHAFAAMFMKNVMEIASVDEEEQKKELSQLTKVLISISDDVGTVAHALAYALSADCWTG